MIILPVIEKDVPKMKRNQIICSKQQDLSESESKFFAKALMIWGTVTHQCVKWVQPVKRLH